MSIVVLRSRNNTETPGHLMPVHLLVLLICLSCLCYVSHGLKEGQCEVCIGVINKLTEKLSKEEINNQAKIESRFREFCLESKKADNRFCYYVGGLEESATKIVGEMAKPLSWGLPPEKICERLMKNDPQICELRYEKTIDLRTVDLKKLRVKDLKKILNDWDERCENCIEKSEFIKRVEELKPKYVKSEL